MILAILVCADLLLTVAVLILVLRIRQSQLDVDSAPTEEQVLEEDLNSRLRRLQTAQFSAPMTVRDYRERKM
jgi:hypothetical protein